MTETKDRTGEGSERMRAVLRVLAPLVVLALIVILILYFANDKAGINREAVQTPMVALAPPPPPPPPPPVQPKEKPPEPEKTVETPQPTPKPEAPQKTNDAPKQLSINGPAQTGSDAFGVAAGGGGGLTVGGDPNGSDHPGDGFGAANYGRYLTGEIQRRIQADDRLSRFTSSAKIMVWVAPDGAITRVALVAGSGDARNDQEILTTVRGIGRFSEPPPSRLKMPILIALRGRL